MKEDDKNSSGWSILGAMALLAVATSIFSRPSGKINPPEPMKPKSGGISLSLIIELVTVVLLAFTAWIQYDAFVAQRGRPFLTVNFEEIRQTASGEKVLGNETVEWVYSIKNSGPVPAFQVRSYGITTISGQAIVGLNLSTYTHSSRIENMPSEHIVDGADGIVAPGNTVTRTFLMPRVIQQALLDSANKNKDGMAIRVDYASPWDKKGVRPHFYQSRMIPWRDGKYQRFKINNSDGN